MKFRIKYLALFVAAAYGLAACGGGGGGAAENAGSTSVLSGTAAVGTPIVGATVSIRCANGLTATSQPTSSTGLWTVSMTDATFPCAVQLNGGTINSVANTTALHSIALASGTLNVSPITDLMVAFTTHAAVPSIWFSSLQSSGLTAIEASSLQAALSLFVNVLNMNQLSASVNPMTTTFVAVSGNVIDDTLTALAAAMTNVGISYNTLLSQVSAQNPVVSDGLAAAIVSEYEKTASGTTGISSAPIGNNTTTGQAANGSPRIAVANCAASAGAGTYAQCQANAIANFGPVMVHDIATGTNCTANYVDGVLTVSNGTVNVTGYMNGNFLSGLNVFGTGSAMTAGMISAYSATGASIGLSSVNWTSTGTVKSIYGKLTNMVGSTTEFTCTN